MLLCGVAALGGLLLAVAFAVAVGAVPASTVSTGLRHGASAFLLGAVYALASPHAPRWHRLSFPVLAMALATAAQRLALDAGGLVEMIALPFATGPALISGAAAGVWLWIAGRWLGHSAGRIGVLAAAAAGTGSFLVLLALHAATAWHHVSLLALYYALWSMSVSAVWGAEFSQPAPAAGRCSP